MRVLGGGATPSGAGILVSSLMRPSWTTGLTTPPTGGRAVGRSVAEAEQFVQFGAAR